MNIDLIGRVANTWLAEENALLPLFEAIINSIHALQDSGTTGGRISIKIEREISQSTMNEVGIKVSRDIKNFCIEDNGIGFTDANYSSFNTADTQFKRDRGAKGVGRFIWLKAFEQIEVESFYTDGNERKRRSFLLRLTKDGIERPVVEDSQIGENKTKVRLCSYFKTFERNCPRRAATIARKIIEHCLVYFLDKNCAQINLSDDDETVVLNLNQIFRDEIESLSKLDTLEIRDHKFDLKYFRLYTGEAFQHAIHLCGNQRDVRTVSLQRKIPCLLQKLKDTAGKPFVHLTYVTGQLLDDRLNQERTDFQLPRISEPDMTGEPSEDELMHRQQNLWVNSSGSGRRPNV